MGVSLQGQQNRMGRSSNPKEAANAHATAQPQYLSHSTDCRKPITAAIVIANLQHLLQSMCAVCSPAPQLAKTFGTCHGAAPCCAFVPLYAQQPFSPWAWYQAGAHTHTHSSRHKAAIMHSIETRSPYIVRLGLNVTHCHGDYKDRLHKITARKRQLQKTIAHDCSTEPERRASSYCNTTVHQQHMAAGLRNCTTNNIRPVQTQKQLQVVLAKTSAQGRTPRQHRSTTDSDPHRTHVHAPVQERSPQIAAFQAGVHSTT